MKKIIIVGANSYIGTALQHHLESGPYHIQVVDVLNPEWDQTDFSGFETVIHIAAIVHQKERPEMEPLYFQVNRDLALKVARKAKAEGVGQFIFMSSMSVYGKDSGIITPDTIPVPATFYGKSKLEAEELLTKEADESFRVCILRPPMVYGSGCKGNFQTVVKLIRKLPVFPQVCNQRSMIHIDNLCEFLKLCIDQDLSGLYFPQNREYVQTSQMAKCVADSLGRRIHFSPLLGLCVILIRPFVGTARKAFGTLIYERTEQHNFCYCIHSNEESFTRSI